MVGGVVDLQLGELGAAEAVALGLVSEIVPSDGFRALDKALSKVRQYDWIIFTSRNAVDIFFARLKTPLRRVRIAAVGPSTVVGFAHDGFPIVVERDARGNLPTNADLDRCHGRTSTIVLDGKKVEMYHYSATYEFPYFIGCYAGTPIP